MNTDGDPAAWGVPHSDPEIDRVLSRYGIRDEYQRRRVERLARAALTRRAVKDVTRVIQQRALEAGWSPPSAAREPMERLPLPTPTSVQDRVIRWARGREDFSVRDLQRACGWFETAVDVKTCLDGLVARGLLETMPSRRKRIRGRPPGPRYRATSPPVPAVDARSTGTPLEPGGEAQQGIGRVDLDIGGDRHPA